MIRENNVAKIAISVLGRDEPIVETNVDISVDDRFLMVRFNGRFIGFYPLQNVECFYVTLKGEEHGN